MQFVDIENLRPLDPNSDDEIFPLFSKLTPPKSRRPVTFPEASSGPPLLSLRRMNQEQPSNTRLVLSSSVSQPQPQRVVRRRQWGVWMIRLLVVVTDVIIFLFLDNDSASNDHGDATPPAMVLSSSSLTHGTPALARQLSHARARENPEFRMMERLVFDESGSQHSTGSRAGCILSVVFLGGVCLEVLWKEIYQKGRQRR
jgi:hypothetical protein